MGNCMWFANGAELRMRDYSGLSRVEVERRLDAAEDVCALVGWTAVRRETEREKALHEMWVQWSDLGGDSSRPGNPHLTDSLIAELAGRRDRIREATLRRLAEVPGGRLA